MTSPTNLKNINTGVMDKKINNIRNSYDEAKKTLYSGNRSVVKTARKMEEFGIELKPGNQLPQPSEIEN